jgi:hypothetical protein
MPTPSVNDHLRIDSVFEPLHRKTFIAELAVERLVRSILPRFTGFDERRVDVDFGQPLQHRFRNELRSMIRPQYLRSTVNADQFGEYLDDTARADAPWASPEIPDTGIRCKEDLGGMGWELEGCSLGSSSLRQ